MMRNSCQLGSPLNIIGTMCLSLQSSSTKIRSVFNSTKVGTAVRFFLTLNSFSGLFFHCSLRPTPHDMSTSFSPRIALAFFMRTGSARLQSEHQLSPETGSMLPKYSTNILRFSTCSSPNDEI